ncbi:MAG TPA: MlaD family protein [Solirubrobacterales bacterium]|jgi:ABC-type transporter Mla subunit MlaD|nr:MlaD family protein [Solirubrobacterales bacterium]
MSKRALLVLGLVAAVIVVVLLVSGGGSDDGYRVRAVFDNGGFMVKGEEVRVAGANVGEIESVDVSGPDENVAYRDGKPVPVPGKAIIVMKITDPGFQDFRKDATCQIRPQSLIGEKFVDCRTTLPRAPGSEPAPALEQIEDGEPGEGQYLLPLGNNGTSVDPDLINDIQSLPYAQRFRLIFNELGGALAGRGEDLEVLVKRANPVLRDVDRLFGILSAQREELAQLASDSDAILAPLARERRAVGGFFTNSGAAAEASAEKGPELEEALQKFPTFLAEFRQTMKSLKTFSDAGTPLLEDFGTAAPSLTDATETLTPFSEALTVSLKSLGNAGEASGSIFAEADPVVKKARDLAKSGVKPTGDLANLLVDIKQTGGWDGLTELIYGTAASLNGFDKYGHFGRTRVTLSACVEYEVLPAGLSGCVANFNGPKAGASASTDPQALFRLLQQGREETNGGTGAEAGPTIGVSQGDSTDGAAEGQAGVAQSSKTEGTEPLLDYLLGP